VFIEHVHRARVKGEDRPLGRQETGHDGEMAAAAAKALGRAILAALLLPLACRADDGVQQDAASQGASTAPTSDSATGDSATSAHGSTTEGSTTEGTTTEGSTTEGTTADSTTTETATTDTTTDTDASVAQLQIDPPHAIVVVDSGWSFPVDFTLTALDGRGQIVPLQTNQPITWTVDDPNLGVITRHGGAFQAHNTAVGLATVTASAAGLQAHATVQVEHLLDPPVCPPKPQLSDGPPAPGAFVRVVAPEYEGSGVYHGLYLPPDWQPDRRYPVIVESPCNKYGAFSGKVDDAALGYHLAGCRAFVWIVVPYIQGQSNLDYGWGDVPATIAYWSQNVPRALQAYGGDAGAVLLAGFSRGAIGASYIGLSGPEIADTWLAFIMHSHADVVSNLTPDQGAGSALRMQRIAGRTTLLSWGAAGDGGAVNSLKGVDLLTGYGYPLTAFAVPGVGHTDAWAADDPIARQTAQTWLFDAVAARPGTHTIRGRVTDLDGLGVHAARVTSGAHSTTTDLHGYYALRGLLPGARELACAHPTLTCPPSQIINLSDVDLEDVDLLALP
jgi:hypothetical protein